MVNVLVTGGAGYIGSHTCKTLKHHGFTPICFDNFSQGHKEFVQWGELFEGDLRDPKSIETALKKYNPEAVLHFAASAYVVESMRNPAKYYQNNVLASIHLISACQKLGIQHLVFSSTCATYGMPKTLPIVESTPQNPINPYGKTKWMIEQILQDYESAYGMTHAILRYFNAAGASIDGEIGERHHPETHLIPLLIESALCDRPFTIYGNDFATFDGYAVRDFIHVEDLATAHVLALQYLLKKKKSLILNLGSSKGYSVQEVIQAVEKVTGKKIEVKIASKRLGEPDILIANHQKAKRLLHFEPKHSLDSIIQTACNFAYVKQ